MGKKDLKFSGNHIFFLLLLISFVVIIAGLVIGENQDKAYLQERARLDQAEKYLNEGLLDKAEPILADLVARRPDSYLLQWYYGKCLAWKGENRAAIEYFKKAQDMHPFIVKDFSFTFQMGEILYNNEEYPEAAQYLQVAYLLNSQKEDRKKVNQLLANIDEENKRFR